MMMLMTLLLVMMTTIDDDDHEEEAELALGQRWDRLQLADFVLNVAQVDRGQGGRNGRL